MSTPDLISTKSVKLKVRAVLHVIRDDLNHMREVDRNNSIPKMQGARIALLKVRKKLREEFYL